LKEQYETREAGPKKGSAGILGGRPVVELEPVAKHRRRTLLQYLNTRDVGRLIKAYKKNEGVDERKQQMLAHIEELEEIGTAYPQPFKVPALWESITAFDEDLMWALQATDEWSERIEALRESIND
jgi:hypothetical protein